MYRHDEEDISAGVDSFLDMAGKGRMAGEGRTAAVGALRTAGVTGAASPAAEPSAASALGRRGDARPRGRSYVQHCPTC
ncbi:hypothetical protein C5B89_12840 [Haloferax sp. Atlit-47N]|uniref:Uncharacterized protein n=1 Tax=Haloferax volcanii TaxID=2246 RepID=A0A558G138_HALVO|nr:hypothetical protein DEQ67_12870 [Haloferax sp. Atlit-48N]RDZ34258.1 hypothetical protein C5B88_16695 [Haloferax sp. Atlit-24N]RDZ38532.1 hypothetical protein C5B89_12840 [Haloferax sp. Atlit-47N]RLM36392.1 hypothetical protein DVK03_14735 [Haloferax sp. Atlit-109R]RLM41757.1 hypothetical protein DVK04_15630 [Haloferax sp. Atlit-105R]TVT91491.1 hypothetical protein FQA18_17600 [Haloferax volcanii]